MIPGRRMPVLEQDGGRSIAYPSEEGWSVDGTQCTPSL